MLRVVDLPYVEVGQRGDFTLDAKALRNFRAEVDGKDPLVIPRMVSFRQVTVGSRRLVAHGGANAVNASWLACELHQSGAGSFAAIVVDREIDRQPGRPIEKETVCRIQDEDLVLDIWSGVRLLARHARDRAAAGGTATVRATIWPVYPDLQAELHQPRGHGGGSLGRNHVTEPPQATGIFDIDDLAQDGPPQIAATSVLAASLLQHFGYPETLQMTTDGVIRSKYWSAQRYGPRVQAWAAAADVKTTDETVE